MSCFLWLQVKNFDLRKKYMNLGLAKLYTNGLLGILGDNHSFME